MRSTPPLVVVAAVTAAAAAVVTCGLTAAAAAERSRQTDQLSRDTAQNALRTEVLSAGRQIAVDFAQYDYRHIDADFQRVAQESAGSFKKQYVTQAAGIRELIIRAKSVSTAQVASEGLVDVAPTQATVVVALDRTIKNTSSPKGQQASFGLQIDLTKQGSRWLATGVKPL